MKLYHSIVELPLRNYIEGTVHNNISAIIKEGVCEDEQLLFAAWEDIKAQYAEALGDESFKFYVHLLKQINRLRITIDQVQLCVEILRRVYTDRFAQELNKLLNANIKFDPTNRESYERSLKSCLSRNKANKINLDLKMSQFEAIGKKEGESKPATEEYYHEMLIILGDHKHVILSADRISVFDFATRIKHLNQEITRKEKEARR